MSEHNHSETNDARVCPACTKGRLSGTTCDLWPERVHAGSTIVVPKGARVSTYASRGDFIAGRTYKVTVEHFVGEQPRWPGSGGYWTWSPDWQVVA